LLGAQAAFISETRPSLDCLYKLGGAPRGAL
jgi:hypothetical protein